MYKRVLQSVVGRACCSMSYGPPPHLTTDEKMVPVSSVYLHGGGLRRA